MKQPKLGDATFILLVIFGCRHGAGEAISK